MHRSWWWKTIRFISKALVQIDVVEALREMIQHHLSWCLVDRRVVEPNGIPNRFVVTTQTLLDRLQDPFRVRG